MDSKAKELFQKAKQLFQEQKYNESYSYLDILILKDQKNIQYNLLAGLCFQKQKNYEKAKEFFDYAYYRQNDHMETLIALQKLYYEDLKQFQQAQKYLEELLVILKKNNHSKVKDIWLRYIDCLDKNQELDKLEEQYNLILMSGDIQFILLAAKTFIRLKLTLKQFDTKKPKHIAALQNLSQKLLNKPDIDYILLSEILSQVLNDMRKNFYEIEPQFVCSEAYYSIVLELMELFPSSGLILTEVLKFVHCFFNKFTLRKVLKNCLYLLIRNEYTNIKFDPNAIIYDNYKKICQEEYNIIAYKAKIFIFFLKFFATDFLINDCTDMNKVQNYISYILQFVDSIVQEKELEFQDEPQLFLEIPLKVQNLFKTNIKEQMQVAHKLLKIFNDKIKEIQKANLDCNLLEEIGANLGYDVLIDPIQIIEMKNRLKVRINNRAYSLETYEKYFDYQMKIVKLLRMYDEELPMKLLFDKILVDNPDNIKIQIENAWLNFSESKTKEQAYLQIKEKYLQILKREKLESKLEFQILKRLGTITLTYENKMEDALSYFEKASALLPDDYQALMGLGIVHFKMANLSIALDKLLKAFNINQNDYHLNQTLILIYNNVKQFNTQTQFALNIYKLPEFSQVFWLNFLISQHFMQKGQYLRAHDFLQLAIDQFSYNSTKTYRLHFEKKIELGDIGIPYFINQNENYFLCDYPILSAKFIQSQGMEILTELYFKQDQNFKLFQLELKMAEIKKIMGHQGSALKCTQKAEQMLLQSKNKKDNIGQLDKFLNLKIELQDDPMSLLTLFVQKLNNLQVRSKWISTRQLKLIDIKMASHILILNFQAAQLEFYCKNEYYAQERIIQALLIGLYFKDNEKTLSLLLDYCPLVFEIGCFCIEQQYKNFSFDSAKDLCKKYDSILEIYLKLTKFKSLTLYANECLRNYYYLQSFLNQEEPKQAYYYCLQLCQQLTQVDLINFEKFNAAIFKEIRAQLSGNDKKIQLFRNNLSSLVIIRKKLNHNISGLIQLALSLFPQEEIFHFLKSFYETDEKKKISCLLQALKVNPRCSYCLCYMGIQEFKMGNYSWSQQFFLRSIESDPQFSLAYSGLCLIGLQYFNECKKVYLDPNNDEQPQKRLQQFFESSLQLKQKIESYMKYTNQLENRTFKNIIEIMFNSQFGQDESEISNIGELLSSFIQQLPIQMQSILLQETEDVKDKVIDQLRETFAKQEAIYSDRVEGNINKLKQFCVELLDSLTQYMKNQEIKNQLTENTFGRRLQLLFQCFTLYLSKINEKIQNVQEYSNELGDYCKTINELIYNNFFRFISRNQTNLQQAALYFNYNQDFILIIQLAYKIIRKIHFLNTEQYFALFIIASKLKLECSKINNESTQLILQIDRIMTLINVEGLISPEIIHYHQLLQALCERDAKKIHSNIKLCILYQPSSLKYRNILDQVSKMNKRVKISEQILERKVSSPFLALKWLDTILHFPDKANNSKILKYKIIPFVNDPKLAKSVLKVAIDLHFNADILIQTFNLQEKANKYRIQNDIYKLTHSLEDRANLIKLINTYNQKYLSVIEDEVSFSRKISIFLTPLLINLFQHYKNKMISIFASLLSYCAYAEDQSQNKKKLKYLHLIINIVRFNQQLIIRQQSPVEALIKFLEIQEDLLNQATYSYQALSLYFNVLIAAEKYDELENWLTISSGYINNNDDLTQFANLVLSWAKVINLKTEDQTQKISGDTNSIQSFLQQCSKFIQQIKNTSLLSLIYFMQGQAMLYQPDWQLSYQPNQIIQNLQLSLLYNPTAKDSLKLLTPLKQARQEQIKREKENQKKKVLKLKNENDIKPKLKIPKQEESDGGLNSDSDEQEIQKMDFEHQLKEYQEQGIDVNCQEFQLQMAMQFQTQQYMQQQQQQFYESYQHFANRAMIEELKDVPNFEPPEEQIDY